MDMTADEKQLWLENKKLSREVKRLTQDIALLRSANEQAANSQAYIQRSIDRQMFYVEQLMKTAPNVLIMTDDQMRTVMVSDLYYRFNDTYDKSEIQRGIALRDAMNGMPEQDLDSFLKKCRSVLAGKNVKSYLVHWLDQGALRHLRVSIRRMSRDREIVGLNIQFADVTEIVDALERAEAADKAKSNFLANMSHEIRTPINAMLGLNEMILRESGERETLGYAEDVQAAGKTLLALVNEILDFSKVEEGKMEILPTQYALGSTVNDLVNMIRGRAEEKGLSFKVYLDPSTPGILLGDEIRIRQCALNILTNAVKYTKKGSVTLDVGYEKLDDERILLRFSVIDTGIGLRQEDMDRLYAPFSRIEEKRNRSIEGTGLGMSITRGLLELMGSRLEVRSTYGKGSIFSFAVEQPVIRWVPVGEFTGRLRSDDAHRPAYRESFRAPEARVLVVDDMPANLAVVKGLLKRTQVGVETALSGKEAITKAAQQDFDVIFVDHMMPEMDGIETLHELKKLPGKERTAFIALTANAISGSRELYLKEGFTDYLSKPVDGAKLEEMLMDYLPPEKVLVSPKDAPAAAVGTDKPTVLIVDDDALTCRLAGEILGKSFRVEPCSSGTDAPTLARQLHPDLILLDINLSGLSGFDVLRELREHPSTIAIPVIFLTGERDENAEIEGFRSGASDFVRKPFVPEVLLQRTRRIIELDRLQRDLQSEVRRQTLRAGRLTEQMMLALSKTVDAKDHYTNGHSARVAAYSAEIARRMGKSAQEQLKIYEMGLMHDIGKIGVSEEIINKATRLTNDEFERIKQHTVTGSKILSLITEMPELASGARSHHERYDGSGYPDGLKGKEIPEAARIICLADCYDAMTSTRTYSAPKPQAEVRAEIERCSGTQFDPEIVPIMLEMIDEDVEYRMTERTTGDAVWAVDRQLEQPDGVRDAEADEDESGVALPELLYGIDEIDVAQGLRFCGTAETYLETATIFAKNLPAVTDELEGLWNAGDVAGVALKAHALKSTSRTIGAEALGALAEKLEMAGKAGDAAVLNAELDGMLSRCRALARQLAPLTGAEGETDGAELPEFPAEHLQGVYDMIRELSGEFEFDRVMAVIDSLSGYRLPEDERSRVRALKQAAEAFEWEQIDSLLPPSK